MKKQLLTTTALVAAGLITASGTANAVKLGISGYQEAIVGVVDNDNTVRKGTGYDVHHDGEVHFKSSTTLDNGLKIRLRAELELATQRDTIDEAYIDVSGKWGAIRMGAEDNAASLMVTPTFGAWSTNVGQNTHFDVTDWVIIPSGFKLDLTHRLELGEGDSEKITYFTPRIAGLQFGISYMPSGEEDKNSSNAPVNVDLLHGWAAATNYRGKFGGVGLGLAAGYASGKQPGGETGPDFEGDPKGWALSGAVAVAGVKVAAGYMARRSVNGTGTGANDAGESLSFGAKYDFGMNHISAGYAGGWADGTKANTKDDEADRVMISYRRDLAKGIQYRLNLIYADFVGEDAGKDDDNEGLAVTTGVRVAF